MDRQDGNLKQFVIAVLVVGVLMGFDRWGWLRPVRAGVEWLSGPMRLGLVKMGEGVSGVVDKVGFVYRGVARIEDLERENAKLRVEAEKVRVLAEENEQLRELAGMGKRMEQGLKLMGKVVGKVAASELVVNKGRGAGVDRGTVVVTAEGVVVGRVVEVGEYTSRIKLLTDVDSQVAVRVGEGATGKLKGTGGDGLILEGVEQGEILAVEDTVVTLGSEGVYPEGLVIGKVRRVLESGAEVYQQADILPAIMYHNIRYLFFLK